MIFRVRPATAPRARGGAIHAWFASACLTWCALAAPVRGAQPAAVGSDAIVLPAQVFAYQSVVLTAKVAGFLKAIEVDKGDQVRAGALIAELEVPELLADQLRYRAQLDVAQRDYQRIQQAAHSAPDLVTPESIDGAQGRYEVAQAELARVTTLLGYARITAPFSGTITARFVDPGAFIPVASASGQQSAAIVALMDFSHVRVQIPVPESDVAVIRPGCSAVVTSVALPGSQFAASVTRISYAIEPGSRTMLAEIDMVNPDGRLQPGMYVSVRLTPAPRTRQP